MKLELEVKKLEKRETKVREPTNIWCISANFDAIEDLMNAIKVDADVGLC
ncbi:MAG: hypothetical protein SVJ22_04800 [Halobacteriota archaeon]|nr:hypothetical protein [Halobacteriota archaeon]